MKKAIILLFVLGNLLTIAVAFGELFPFVQAAYDFGAWVRWLTVIPLGLHAPASVITQRRFKRKYGLSAGKFLLCGVLPAVIIGAAVLLTGMIIVNSVSTSENYDAFFGLLSTIEIALAVTVYSIAFLGILAAALGISSAVRRHKESI